MRVAWRAFPAHACPTATRAALDRSIAPPLRPVSPPRLTPLSLLSFPPPRRVVLGKAVIDTFKLYADFFDGCATSTPPFTVDAASTAAASAWGFTLADATSGACPTIETQPHFAYLNMASYQMKLALMSLAETSNANSAQSFDFFATKCAKPSPFGDWYTVAEHKKIALLDSQCQLNTFAFVPSMVATLDHYLNSFGQKTAAYDAAAFNMYWHVGGALSSKMAQLAQMLDKSHELLTKVGADGKCSMVNIDDVIKAEQRLDNHHEREKFAFHKMAFEEVDHEFHSMYACIVQGGALPSAALGAAYYIAPAALPAVVTPATLSAELGLTVTIVASADAYPKVAMSAALVAEYASVPDFNAKSAAPAMLGAQIATAQETATYAECVAAAAAQTLTMNGGTPFYFFPYDGPVNDAPGANCYWAGSDNAVDKPEIRAVALTTVAPTAGLPAVATAATSHFALAGQYSGVDCQKICDKVAQCEAFVLRVDPNLLGHCYLFNSKAATLPVTTGFVGVTFGFPSWVSAGHSCEVKLAMQSFAPDASPVSL